jgi:GT2 family glycosyltransferase
MPEAERIEMTHVSVVIPTHNRATDLEVCLEALLRQTYPADRFEILVADDGSTDGTEQLVERIRGRSDHQVRWLGGPRRGPSAARNRGIRHAKGQWVAMTDDDCLPAPDWLERLCDAVEAHPEWAGCGGRIVRRNESRISRFIDDSRTMDHPVTDGQVIYLVTANAIYRKAVLDEVGGFEESIGWPGGEDPDLSDRIRERGYRLGVEPAAVISHKHRDTIRGLYRMFWHHGRGNSARFLLGRMARQDHGRRSILGGWRRARRHLRRKDLSAVDRGAFLALDMVRATAFAAGYNSLLKGHEQKPS